MYGGENGDHFQVEDVNGEVGRARLQLIDETVTRVNEGQALVKTSVGPNHHVSFTVGPHTVIDKMNTDGLRDHRGEPS